jgi:hypothetical protein
MNLAERAAVTNVFIFGRGREAGASGSYVAKAERKQQKFLNKLQVRRGSSKGSYGASGIVQESLIERLI